MKKMNKNLQINSSLGSRIAHPVLSLRTQLMGGVGIF